MPRKQTLEDRISDLEEERKKYTFSPTLRWDAIAIIAVWICGAAMLFSPVGATHYEGVLWTVGVVSALIVVWFDNS